MPQLGYWGMPEKTAEAWRNGWFHTGDGFRRDEEGNYYFVDRQKDALRRRGENVSSFEVEGDGARRTPTSRSARRSVSTPGWASRRSRSASSPRTARPSTRPRSIEFLIPKMPRFMVPRYVEVCTALPKTEATMRVQKAKLREDPFTDATWDREAAGIVVPK